MSKRIRGRIAIDESANSHFKGLVGYRVELVLDSDNLFGKRAVLGHGQTGDEGLDPGVGGGETSDSGGGAPLPARKEVA